MGEPLGIIAGGGPLPGQVAAAARDSGRDVFIAGIERFAEPGVIGVFPHEFFRLGAIGAMCRAFRERGCADLVMIGPVKRPSFLSLRPDAEGAKMLARVGKAAFLGDDGLLAAIVRVLSEEGFRILGAHDVLSGALAPEGLLSRIKPDEAAKADIARGVEVLKLTGAADIGQACVVQQGIVLAVETVEGTDAMLSRIPSVARPGPAGVLVKLAKPGQERRVDLPALGPGTILNAAAAGVRGIAFEAGGALLTDKSSMIATADEKGVFLIGIRP